MLDILEETGLLGSKPVENPMDPNVKLYEDQGELLSNIERYRCLVGKLNYLTITHPDILFAVSVLSQYMKDPHLPHWEAIIQIMRYLKAYPGHDLLYKAKGHLRGLGWITIRLKIHYWVLYFSGRKLDYLEK